MQKAAGREFHITVLDWELERILYGNEVIGETGGAIQARVHPEKKEQTELKLIIAAGLSQYLKIPCFTGDSCLAASQKGEEGWERLHPIARHQRLDHGHLPE